MNDYRSQPRCWACLNFETPNDAEPCLSCTDESAFIDARAECKRLTEELLRLGADQYKRLREQTMDQMQAIQANNRADALADECKRLRELLAEARDDVAAELERCRDLAGYPSTDRRLAAQTDLLSRIDAAIGSTT